MKPPPAWGLGVLKVRQRRTGSVIACIVIPPKASHLGGTAPHPPPLAGVFGLM